MSKLLTIAIPTYNRSEMLLKQLNWLVDELTDFADQCNIVVHDNCSTDNTPQVVQQWELNLKRPISFIYYRNKKNTGGMANIVSCLEYATGKFVWTLGDDDPIAKGAVADILSIIKAYSNLGMILLNGYGKDVKTGEIKIKQWFHKPVDSPGHINPNDFNYFLVRNSGGILFISSAVYRTDLVQKALMAWPHSERNLAAQAFWVGYCAAHGSFIITSKLYTECAMGIGFSDKNPQWTFTTRFIDFPEVFNKLMQHGYDKKFCLFQVLQNIKNKQSVKIILGAFKRWPLFAAKGAFRYSKIVLAAMLFYTFRKNTVNATLSLKHESSVVSTGQVDFNFLNESKLR
jgi:glycosyltransferase involved in cell wall biosynthesis